MSTYELHAMEKNLLRIGHISAADLAHLPHWHPWGEKGLKSSDRNIRLACCRSSRIASLGFKGRKRVEKQWNNWFKTVADLKYSLHKCITFST
jgi:hypothetical protein